MSNFEDRLIGELMDEHGPALAVLERPEPRRRSNRPLWMTGSVLTVALAAAAVLTLTTGSSSPAYAVTQNPNGTVTLTLADLTGVDGANAELRGLGLPVRVLRVEDNCHEQYQVEPFSFGMASNDLPVASPVRSGSTMTTTAGQFQMTFSLNGIPRGETLVVAATSHTFKIGPNTVLGIGISKMGLVKGTPPTCAPVVPLRSVPGVIGDPSRGNSSGTSPVGSAGGH